MCQICRQWGFQYDVQLRNGTIWQGLFKFTERRPAYYSLLVSKCEVLIASRLRKAKTARGPNDRGLTNVVR